METKLRFFRKLSASIITAAVFAAALFAIMPSSRAYAADDTNVGRTFYFEELKNSELAQRFYSVMQEMADEGKYNDGKYEYDLSSVLTQDELADYVVNSSPTIPVAFGAARDAFLMDHPELFYVDVYKLYLTAGTIGGEYAAFIGTGSADNYYADNTFVSTEQVTAAISAFDAALNNAVDAAKADGAGIIEQIKNANAYLLSVTDYDYSYGARKTDNGVEYDGHVYTAYGALVNGKAVCSGYARAFKTIMDRLGIPCVLIQGGGYTGNTVEGCEPGYEPHMWNAVLIDGLWYGVDVTWNETSMNGQKYLLVGDDYLSQTHIEDSVISTSGFELKYPKLRPLGYGVNEDKGGFVFLDSGTLGSNVLGYKEIQAESGTLATVTFGVSYDGKDAAQLAAEGKYLAFRYSDESQWIGKAAYIKALESNIDTSGMYVDGYTIEQLAQYEPQVQYAIIDYAPDAEYTLFLDPEPNIAYDPDKLTDEHIVTKSAVYKNNGYGSYVPAPFVLKMTPDEKGSIKSFEPIDITLEYNKTLKLADGYTEADLEIVITGTSADLGNYAATENVKWDGDKKITFTLVPSKQYKHNFETYNMVPNCLVAEDSGKAPNAARLTFEMKKVVCSKVFNDGRLYMKVYGQPQFVSAVDESENGFADKNGQPIVGDQRSQLMLVVNEPTAAERQTMTDMLDSAPAVGISSSDILSSSTYQIDLQMCGMVQKVPTGSYMQVGFGYPEGYEFGKPGVTYTVYHYKRDANGEIIAVEQVPCVITEYGIIATVDSFSPYMVCAVPADKAPNGKTVYASVTGAGGSISNSGVSRINGDGSVSYVLTADEGYIVDKIMLNGKDVKSALVGNVLSLGYAELDAENAIGNVLEVSFISNRVKNDYTEKGLTVVAPKLVVTQADMIESVMPVIQIDNPTPGKSNAGLIAGIVVPSILVLGGGGAAAYFITRKNKSGGNGKNNGKSNGNGGGANAAVADKTRSASKAVPTRTGSVSRTTAATRTNSASGKATETVKRTPSGVNKTTAAHSGNAARPAATSRSDAARKPSAQGTARTAPTRTSGAPKNNAARTSSATRTPAGTRTGSASRPVAKRNEQHGKPKK